MIVLVLLSQRDDPPDTVLVDLNKVDQTVRDRLLSFPSLSQFLGPAREVADPNVLDIWSNLQPGWVKLPFTGTVEETITLYRD